MSTKRMTETGKFYILGLGLLLSSVLSSCYGPEIDRIDENLAVVQNDMDELKKKIEQIEATISSMDWVTGVTPISGTPGGWNISFDKHTPIPLYNGTQGAQGSNGANGLDGTMWYIGEDSIWHSKPVTIPEWSSGNPLKAIGEDGRDAPSPEVINGKWTFFTWNKTLAQYDTTYTNFVADTTRSYLVDKNVKYELYFPMKVPDTSSVAVAGDSILSWKIIDLPKYQEEPLAIYFKGFGYISHDLVSAAGPQDSIVMLPDGLSFASWSATNAADPTTTPPWHGTKQIYANMFTSTLPPVPNLVAVFSTNKTRTTTENISFELQNSKGVPLNYFSLYNPQYIGDKLLTKVTQSDSLFYLTVAPSGANGYNWTIQGNIYYYLVSSGSRSAAAHTINGSPTRTNIPEAESGKYNGVIGVLPQSFSNRTGSRYVVQQSATPYQIGLSSLDNIYDLYIDSAGGVTPTTVISTYTLNPLSLTFKTVFNPAPANTNPITTDPPLSTDSIDVNLVLRKLMKTGEIYHDSIRITVIP